MVLIYFISSNLRFTPSIDGRGGPKIRGRPYSNKVANKRSETIQFKMNSDNPY